MTKKIAHWHGGHLRQRLVRGLDPEIQSFRLQASAPAFWTRLVAAIAAEKHADVHLVGLGLKPGEESLYAVPLPMLPGFLGISTLAINDPILIGFRQLIERTVHVAFVPGRGPQKIALELPRLAALERFHHA